MEEFEIEIEINQSCFEQDFDDIAYDPIEVDDSDEEAAELYDY